ncbi:MAG: DEAD/DEAH box helicase [Alphaproteobacteria bacterium]|nr:DEAD/DEAH box helicase [Alphaproteobacteria bacterium]
MTKFTDLGLSEAILRAVSKQGYDTPTPIQAKVIPAMLDGRDILGIAQTGTGKTASFVLPILEKIIAAKKQAVGKTCHALILAPTRELAAQIADSVRTYGAFAKISVATVVGGARPGPQVMAMKRGVDVLVATPGRLIDHCDTGVIRLDRTHTVVLDEADQMMDLGFLPPVRKILSKIPGDRQTLLLSATMPKQIKALASDILSDPAEISVSPVSRPIDQIDQRLHMVGQLEKRDMLIEILAADDVDRAIVFTRTKRGADRVCQYLDRAGISAAAIHGDKSQGQRERALAAFKKSRVKVLVATDIAARGIDIDDVSHVVNYELPNVPEAYVHRIGRTARAGRSGVAISLCDQGETSYARDIERLTGTRLLPDGVKITPPPKPGQRATRGNQPQQPGSRRHRDTAPGKPVHGKPAHGKPARDNQGAANQGAGKPAHAKRADTKPALNDNAQRKRRPNRNRRPQQAAG